MSDDTQPPRPHTQVTIRQVMPHATVEGATALVLVTDQIGTLFVPLSQEGIQAIQKALTELGLILAQSTGNA